MNEASPLGRAKLPAVDKVLKTDVGAIAIARFGQAAATDAVRHTLNAIRTAVLDGNSAAPTVEAAARAALDMLHRNDQPSVRRVFNLTGTVLHTNLGRAVLPEVAIEAAIRAMRYPIALEFDLDQGKRGVRDDHVAGLVREITGAEDACFVNNNAGAVLLVLNALGAGREAIVSRGELIEIGGAFRLPDIMARAGVRLVEVGTTNRTHFRDYENAIGPDTALLMKAHTSNYMIQGFTASVAESELAGLARRRGVVFVNDLGSGTLIDLARYGLKTEPTVQEALKAGADIVTFSGDKLLGGPQCGIIAGRTDLIASISKNPMKRALRLDKIRLAALEATLKLYRDPDRLADTLPTLRAFVRPRAEIEAQAGRVAGVLGDVIGADFDVGVAPCSSQIGSGALPLETLPSAAALITPRGAKHRGRRLELLSSTLRRLPIPVVGYIREDALWLDMRCLDDEKGFLAQLPELGRLSTSEGSPGNDR